MKILYVATVSNTINAFLIPHIKFLIEKGHQVDIACSINQELKDELIRLNVKVFNIPFSRKPYNFINLKAYTSLKKVITENGYEIIHSHTPIASFICRLITRRSKSIKRIYTAHGFHFYKGAPIINWIIYYPIEKYLSKYTDVLITINKEDYERASKNMKAKKTVLINGVGIDFKKITQSLDIDQKKTELHILPNTFVILSVGELNKNKNHQLIIKALHKITNEDFIYLIVGEGPLKSKLKKLISKKNLQSKVRLLGYRFDVNEIYKISDLFIMPSKREGLPVAVLEALSNSLKIIASNIRGNKDILEEYEQGILVDKLDIESFYNVLKSEINDLKSKKQIIISNFLNKYELNQILSRLETII